MARAADSAGRRRQIMDLAQQMFFRHGFGRVSMDELAAELHVSKSTLYKHFHAKEDLLAAVLQEYYSDIARGIGEIRADEGATYADELRRVMGFLCESLERLDARARRDIQTSAPRIWESLQDLQHRILHPVIEKLLRKGVARRAVRRDLDLALMARVVIVAVEQLLSRETVRSLSLSVQDAYQKVLGIFLEGILAPSA